MDFKDPSISREDKLRHLRSLVSQTQAYRLNSMESNQGKPVYCSTLDKTFSSIKEVSIILSLNRSSVKDVLRGKMKTTGGYSFEWYIPSIHPKPH